MSAVKRYISNLCSKYNIDEESMPILENTVFTVGDKALENVIRYSINHDNRDLFCTLNLERREGVGILSESYLLGAVSTNQVVTQFSLMPVRELPKSFTTRAIDLFSFMRVLGNEKLEDILEVASQAIDAQLGVHYTLQDLQKLASHLRVNVPVTQYNKTATLVS